MRFIKITIAAKQKTLELMLGNSVVSDILLNIVSINTAFSYTVGSLYLLSYEFIFTYSRVWLELLWEVFPSSRDDKGSRFF
jgi:hypothetical protein